jgi:hypothetical protein
MGRKAGQRGHRCATERREDPVDELIDQSLYFSFEWTSVFSQGFLFGLGCPVNSREALSVPSDALAVGAATLRPLARPRKRFSTFQSMS